VEKRIGYRHLQQVVLAADYLAGRKTVAFAESVKESQYADARERKVKLSWAPDGHSNGRKAEQCLTLADSVAKVVLHP
jgi:hypothetical protein